MKYVGFLTVNDESQPNKTWPANLCASILQDTSCHVSRRQQDSAERSLMSSLKWILDKTHADILLSLYKSGINEGEKLAKLHNVDASHICKCVDDALILLRNFTSCINWLKHCVNDHEWRGDNWGRFEDEIMDEVFNNKLQNKFGPKEDLRWPYNLLYEVAFRFVPAHISSWRKTQYEEMIERINGYNHLSPKDAEQKIELALDIIMKNMSRYSQAKPERIKPIIYGKYRDGQTIMSKLGKPLGISSNSAISVEKRCISSLKKLQSRGEIELY
jgi:hypothetical protein